MSYSALKAILLEGIISRTPLATFVQTSLHEKKDLFCMLFGISMQESNSPGSQTQNNKLEHPFSNIVASSYSDLEEGETEGKGEFKMGELIQPLARDVPPKARSQKWTRLIIRKLLLLAGFACAFVAGAMWNTPEWVITSLGPLDSL